MTDKSLKNWHTTLLIILALATVGASLLFGQYKSSEVILDMKEFKAKVIKLELDTGIERVKREGEYNLLNEKIDNLDNKIDQLSDRFDDMLKLLNDKLDGAMILTAPLKEGA